MWLKKSSPPEIIAGDIILANTIASNAPFARLSETAFTIGNGLWTIQEDTGRVVSETGNYVEVSPTAIMMLRAHLAKCPQYSVH